MLSPDWIDSRCYSDRSFPHKTLSVSFYSTGPILQIINIKQGANPSKEEIDDYLNTLAKEYSTVPRYTVSTDYGD